MGCLRHLGRLASAHLWTLLVLVGAAAMAQTATVQVTLRERTPLRLVEYDYGGGSREVGLDGVLEVELKNTGGEPISVRDLDVHSLLFMSEKTGERFILLHSCDCFFVTGDEAPPQGFLKRRTHVLGPGASERLTLEEFGCGGGMWTPPPPGAYLVYYRVLPAQQAEAPPAQSASRRPVSAVIQACKELLLSDAYWEEASTSQPLRVALKKPVRKRVHA